MSVRYAEGMPRELEGVCLELLGELRANTGDFCTPLTDDADAAFNRIVDMCLSSVVASPNAKDLFGKLGPNEDAFGINILYTDDAALRLHFYNETGVFDHNRHPIGSGPVNTAVYGTPHSHIGDISAVIPAGEITHHCFEEVEGEDYTAGYISFVESEDPTKATKFRESVFRPTHPARLEYVGPVTCDATRGYWMPKQQIHVVTWDEPTITVFINDLKNKKQSTVYQPANTPVVVRQRSVDPATREQIWASFTDLARSVS